MGSLRRSGQLRGRPIVYKGRGSLHSFQGSDSEHVGSVNRCLFRVPALFAPLLREQGAGRCDLAHPGIQHDRLRTRRGEHVSQFDVQTTEALP